MTLKKGDKAPSIQLIDIYDKNVNLEDYRGKRVLVSFYRFATCPFCNLRIHDIIKNYEHYNEHFEIIAIFESSHKTLQKKMLPYKAPFSIMSDKEDLYYNAYGVTKSFIGMIKGMVFRMPSMIKSMFSGNIPFYIDSSLIRMPADFLIDENGIVEIAYYGQDEGDHLDLTPFIRTELV